MVVRIVEEAPTAVRPVPPLAIPSVPETSLPPSSMVWPKLVKQVPPWATHPAVTLSPLPVKVEVAVEEFKLLPPVMVRPAVDESPPTCAASPPRRVEVEVLRTERFEIVDVPRYEGIFVARSAPPVSVTPFDDESPPLEIPPVKVDVAVEVALILATYGVVVETTLPELFVERSVEALTLESCRIVPASKVSVPEVKLSEASERRNESESIPSNV